MHRKGLHVRSFGKPFSNAKLVVHPLRHNKVLSTIWLITKGRGIKFKPLLALHANSFGTYSLSKLR
jgi:hypothetical protein